MAGAVRFIANGTITNAGGFQAGATYAGLKTFSEDKLDLGIILSEAPCTSAGVFTTNAIKSPSVTVTQEHVEAGPVRALIVNAGIANTCVGEQGYTDAKEMTILAARRLGIRTEEVLGMQHRRHRGGAPHVTHPHRGGADRPVGQRRARRGQGHDDHRHPAQGGRRCF